MTDIDAAEQFIVSTARVLDCRRYERLFKGGDAQPVIDAVRAYRTKDGGFGHALEPDGRDPAAQPPAVSLALRTLDETDAWDEELVRGACDWLERNAPADGGAMFVAPTIEGWPHPPWWTPDAGLPPSVIFTGLITATLHARGVDHPWLTRATELMWSLIDRLNEPGAYAARGVLAFLQHVPDRDHAEQALERVEPLVRRLVTVDPDAPGEVHGPLDFAPLPDSLARRFFDEDTIEAHLTHFANAQLDDGGWTFNWGSWSPVAEHEWRGALTVDALVRLRDNGRL
jgi:hypothetical protein